MTALPSKPNAPIAVIDIGSNSIRLVIFRSLARHPLKILDDSEMCQLGNTESDGSLSRIGLEKALKTIGRFYAICQNLNVTAIHMMATAAVRNAPNRESLLKDVYELTGYKVQVLTGEDEARLSAWGVISAFGSQTEGLVADMGGSSLELIRLSRGKVCEKISLPLGPLHLVHLSPQARAELIKEALQTSLHLYAQKPTTLYLVGGSCRALAKAHMERISYPLEIIHGYRLNCSEALGHLVWTKKQNPEIYKKFSQRVKKRRNLLALAAEPLSTLLEEAKPQAVVFSGYGLREGLLFSLLSPEEQEKDLLLTSTTTLMNREDKFHNDPQALAKWLEPLLNFAGFSSPQDYRLLAAISALGDCGWVAFQEYRAEYTFNKVLHSPWLMTTHRERFILAVTLYLRYEGQIKSPALKPFISRLSEQDLKFCQTVALGLRLFYSLLDGVPATTQLITYKISDKNLSLFSPPGIIVEDRLSNLVKAFAKTLNLHLNTKVVSHTLESFVSRQEKIYRILTQAFTPEVLEVIDDSHQHQGHAGIEEGQTETHFSVIMVAQAFDGRSTLEKHRLVNEALAELFQEGLHALKLDLKASSS